MRMTDSSASDGSRRRCVARAINTSSGASSHIPVNGTAAVMTQDGWEATLPSLAEGPQALSDRDRRVLLHDPDAVDALHERVWALDDPMAVARWGRPAGKGAEPAA